MGGTETQGGVNNAGAMGLYDPSFNYGGYDMWKGIGKGFGEFGSGISAGSQAQPNYIAPIAGATPFTPEAGSNTEPGLIPQQDQDLIQVLQKLLGGGGGGYQLSGFKMQ